MGLLVVGIYRMMHLGRRRLMILLIYILRMLIRFLLLRLPVVSSLARRSRRRDERIRDGDREGEGMGVRTFSNSILLTSLMVASNCDLMAVFPGSSFNADLNDFTASVGRRIAR